MPRTQATRRAPRPTARQRRPAAPQKPGAARRGNFARNLLAAIALLLLAAAVAAIVALATSGGGGAGTEVSIEDSVQSQVDELERVIEENARQ